MKKLPLLLASFGAAIAIVGGTFAAFAVTDNADPLGVTISPQVLSVDQTVTLEWGAKGLVNIEGLKAGDEKGPYVIGLKATTSTADAYEGNFKISLTDKTEVEGARDFKLIDYLSVYCYEDALSNVHAGDESIKGKLVTTLNAEKLNDSKKFTLTSGEEKKLTIFVTLDSSALTVYNNVLNDVVYLSVDWEKGSELDKLSTGKNVFFHKNNDWANVYWYAWGDEGESTAFPGMAMTETSTPGIYVAQVSNSFKHIIFSDGASKTTTNKTENLDLPALISDSCNCYSSTITTNNGWGSIDNAIKAPAENPVWYVVGNIASKSLGWAGAAGYTDLSTQGLVLTRNKSSVVEEYVVKGVTLTTQDQFKVIKADGTTWAWDGGNYVPQADGTYDIYFRPAYNDAWGGLIYLAK